jgi:uncharacterized membrane protein YgaE (UPF0421/DUF939 family)
VPPLAKEQEQVMKPAEIVTLILGIVSTLLIPLIIFAVRGAIKWTRVEEKLDSAIHELKNITDDKDRVHTEIYTQMREDRAATDRRLRWLEEYLWKRGPRNAA